jgi:hypothetical protein
MTLGGLFKSTHQSAPLEGLFRVTVVAFEDKCNLNCGLRFAELLQRNRLFDVNFFNEPFAKGFLNLQGRNFFDFIDRGSKILSGTRSDILIWGYEEDGKIRLNFHVKNQYLIPSDLSFSLLDSLFVPLSYFSNPENFNESFLMLIFGVIIAAIKPATEEQRLHQPKILQEIIEILANGSAPKDIGREFMPYIMNMLGKIYLCGRSEVLRTQDIKIVKNLFDDALNNRQYMRLPIYYGCIYNNIGQLYEAAYNANKTESFDYLKQAIAAYQDAHKYLNRNYPYDYGLISYHLALLHFELWKHTLDLQALRDAVSQLREAEKVYSLAQFPQSWCHIEGLLGYYLSSLGLSTKSATIMQLAIDCYKNQQKIFEQYTYPAEWAQIQEKIGKIYYLLGKQDEDEKFMQEAKNYYTSAIDIYSNLNMKAAMNEAKKLLNKVKDYTD